MFASRRKGQTASTRTTRRCRYCNTYQHRALVNRCHDFNKSEYAIVCPVCDHWPVKPELE